MKMKKMKKDVRTSMKKDVSQTKTLRFDDKLRDFPLPVYLQTKQSFY